MGFVFGCVSVADSLQAGTVALWKLDYEANGSALNARCLLNPANDLGLNGTFWSSTSVNGWTKLPPNPDSTGNLLASPTNLVAIARTVAQVWQQEGLAKEAREIGKLASDLYDSLAKTQDDLLKTGVHLGRAVNSFNDFARTYEGNVLSRARRLTEKHIKIGKREISEDVAVIEATPRFADGGKDELRVPRLADDKVDAHARDAG